MKEFKGTSGVWSIDPKIKTVIRNDQERGVATVSVYTSNQNTIEVDAENEANAKLIAAAPELLAFALDLIEKVESGKAKSTDSYNKAKLAINKALD